MSGSLESKHGYMTYYAPVTSPGNFDAKPDGSWAWSIVEQSGVTWGEVDERPDGTVRVSAGDYKVSFGPSKAVEAGQRDGEGYDWCSYERDAGGWASTGGGWTQDDTAMAGVLRRYLG